VFFHTFKTAPAPKVIVVPAQNGEEGLANRQPYLDFPAFPPGIDLDWSIHRVPERLGFRRQPQASQIVEAILVYSCSLLFL